MRTLIEIPDNDIAALTLRAKAEGISRAALVRRAVRRLLDEDPSKAVGEAFGLWSDGMDGLDYQRAIRSEW